MKANKISFKYPVKYLEIQDGVIFIFETNKSSLTNPSLEIERLNDRFFLVIGKQFFIPINSLDIISKSKIIKLYLAGSNQATPKAEIFSVIILDEKIIGKLLGIIEMF